MIYSELIGGRYVKLRYVSEEDGPFILELRTNEKYNKYIHATKNDLALQIDWIKEQQKKSGDYYFVIQNMTDEPIGLISLYNINSNIAECGRWISKGNAVENLEAIKLIHEFGFQTLFLNQIYTCTVKDNISVVSFWKRFGGKFDGYVVSNSYLLYKNVIDDKIYSEDIRLKVNRLLYRQ
jgi:RimJ/RimL family protein N-acetyltransferase